VSLREFITTSGGVARDFQVATTKVTARRIVQMRRHAGWHASIPAPTGIAVH